MNASIRSFFLFCHAAFIHSTSLARLIFLMFFLALGLNTWKYECIYRRDIFVRGKWLDGVGSSCGHMTKAKITRSSNEWDLWDCWTFNIRLHACNLSTFVWKITARHSIRYFVLSCAHKVNAKDGPLPKCTINTNTYTHILIQY